jgi:L-fuculose-phosphate aldolase
MNTLDTFRAEIVAIGRRLYEDRLIVAGDGNLSIRLDEQHILTTPSGMCKGMLAPDDLVIVDLAGNVVEGLRKPSSELKMHLAAYRARPDVRAVVHAHPPTAVACTLAGVGLDARLLPELVLTLGEVPTAPYALTGTNEVPESIAPLLPNHNAMLLSHHGALTLGATLWEAFMRMEQVEHGAKVLLMARQLGTITPLPSSRLAELDALRSRMFG